MIGRMSMRIRVSEPRLLPELVSYFLENRCVAQPLDASTCTVVHVDAYDGREAFIEVLFFLRAWQARHSSVRLVLSA
jgi:hypothetical protein